VWERCRISITWRCRNCVPTGLDCAQRAQTSAKASNVNHKWFRTRIRISGLHRIRSRMSAGSLPKYSGFITERRETRPVTVWEMLINLPKSLILQQCEKWKSDLYCGPHQKTCLRNHFLVCWHTHTYRYTQTDRHVKNNTSFDYCGWQLFKWN